ncbi:DDT domain-containing protein PTM [Euphorbia lathyris]|uniref:DDT domain-containing protein PTM n=1 Tax=Euphorbia lathyris TaxID=212925 RepID=UPI0033136F82
MEFLGKSLKKDFTGHGVCCGVVKSYDASSDLFEIVYEGGNSEELGFAEVTCLLEGKEVQPADLKLRPGRKPKKRRRFEPRKLEDRGVGGESGNSNSYNQIVAETLGGQIVEANGNFDVSKKVDLNDGLSGDLWEGERASGNTGIVTVDLNEALEKVSGVEENTRPTANGNLSRNDTLDLNSGFNFNLNEGLDLNEENGMGADENGNLKKRECIDLNLDVNGGGDDNSTEPRSNIEGQTMKCGFDLNLGIDEEMKDGVDGECRADARQSTSLEMVKETTEKMVDTSGALEGNHNEVDIGNGTLQEVPVTNDSCLEFAKGILKKNIVFCENLRTFGSVEVQSVTPIKEDSPEVIDGNQDHLRSPFKEGSGGRRRGRRRLSDVDNLNTPKITPFIDTIVVCGIQNVGAYNEVNAHPSRRRRGNHVNTLNSTPDTTVIENAHVVEEDRKQGDEGSAHKEIIGNNRKRRRLSDSVNATQEMKVLRRSSRRGSVRTEISTITSLSAVNDAINELTVSPSVSALTEEKPLKSCHERPVEPVILPAKVQLPTSSQNLDLDGISVVDLFSVYSCLRSFSTILFLSPFELEDFVAALRCDFPSSLFDFIHVSILQTLRKHLEFLSNEGVESASNCLRSLNWGFLDLVTWPIFMVEYFLIHGLDLKPGYDLSNLELLKNDYYKQPVSVKVEILRCLCDGMMEVEAITSELNRRSSGAELDLDSDRNMNLGALRKMRSRMDVPGGSGLTEEAVDDTADGNIDECCLCKMDGSLICCDGCPAAYHSKCVGVVNDSLPEGDWFCPECAIDRNKPSMKYRSSIRGAEVLGVDPYGRMYFGSCGYLLVSDSCESESSFNYYHRDDLNAVLKVLRSSEMVYSSILEAILKHWDIPVSLYGAIGQTCVSSEGSAETTQTSLTIQNFPKEGSAFSIKFNGTDGGTPQVQIRTGYINYYSFGHIASLIGEELLRKPSDKSIVNSVKTEEELLSSQIKVMSKICPKFHWANTLMQIVDVQKEKCGWCFTCRGSSDDTDCLFNMSLGFVHERSENEGSENDVVSLQSERNKKGHLADIMSHILVVEKRLQGLLLGPWSNPHYSSLWRESVLKASDIESVKHLLLTLESNVRHLALSAEWFKHVDSGTTMGSGRHIIMASSRASSKNGIGKKRVRHSEFDSGPTISVSGLGMLWWRGGRISRRLFSWKVLPRGLVSKAARQAGCMKIPGMLYPENSDFAKRSKYVAWRAAVESSTTAEQLALQVRELDSNIRWDEIVKANPLSVVDKEFKKSVRLFKKVVIRRKSVDGDKTKYLLDFGKRRSIPQIVLKNGSVLEESSSERKKYWLNESYVPLYILKSFEERRVTRISSKMSSEKLSDASVVMKKPSKKRGFQYLFAKAERSEYHQCGHCHKDVPIRDAVCCHYCKGFFHKRHVKKSAGSVLSQCTYTCHRCVSGKAAKTVTKTVENNGKRIYNKSKKGQLQNSKQASVRAVQLKNSKKTLRSLRSRKSKKVTVVVPLRRSPRKVKYKPLQNKKVGRPKKNKKASPQKATYKKKKTKVTSWHKKRTKAYYSYWLNGLLLSRKPDDARVTQFRRKRFLAPSERVILDQPRCGLCCEAGYRSTSTYISCEMCQEWFHGDAFGLNEKNIKMLIGFRCHLCRDRTPPACPLVSVIENHVPQRPEVGTDVGNEISTEPLANEVHQVSLPVSDQSFQPESRLEVDNMHISDTEMEIANAVQGSIDNLNPENAIESEAEAIATSNDHPGAIVQGMT